MAAQASQRRIQRIPHPEGASAPESQTPRTQDIKRRDWRDSEACFGLAFSAWRWRGYAAFGYFHAIRFYLSDLYGVGLHRIRRTRRTLSHPIQPRGDVAYWILGLCAADYVSHPLDAADPVRGHDRLDDKRVFRFNCPGRANCQAGYDHPFSHVPILTV